MINFEFWYFESKYQIFWVTTPSYGVLISIFMIIKKKKTPIQWLSTICPWSFHQFILI